MVAVSMASIGGLGKRTYIIFITSQWASSWCSVVCEGLSRCTVGARGVGAKVDGAVAAPAPAGAMRTRDQGTT